MSTLTNKETPLRQLPLGDLEDHAANKSSKNFLKTKWLRRSLSPLTLLLLWQLATTMGWIETAVLASPLMVWERLVGYILDGSLTQNILVSLGRVLGGLAIGILLGTIFGLLSGLSARMDDIVDPPLQMLRTIPTLALMPLMLIWLGVDEALKVGLIAAGVLFPIYINVSKGIRSVDPGLRELAEVNGVGRKRLIKEIVLPGAWPHFLLGLRFSLGIAWMVLVFAETIAAEAGIGHLLSQGRLFMQTDVIILCLILYAALGLIIESLVRAIEGATLKWRKDFNE